MHVKHASIVMINHGQSIIFKYIINIQDFGSKKSMYIFFYSQSFPYSWIKGLKTVIYEKIKEECNISQNSVKADKIIRSYMMKLVCKTLFVNMRGYPVICQGKKRTVKKTLDTTQPHYVICFYSSLMEL